MSRLVTMSILAALCSLPTGCTFLHAPPQMPLAGYPFRYDGSDFRTAWKTMPSEHGVAVEMMLKNVGYPLVKDLTLEVSLRQGDKVIAKRSASLFGGLRDGDYGKVTVLLKDVTVSPDDLLQFRIKFNRIEGGISHALVSELTVDAVTGVEIDD